MILSHVNIVHYSPVNIDKTDDSLQMELDPSLTRQQSKSRKKKQESTDVKMRQEIGETTTRDWLNYDR